MNVLEAIEHLTTFAEAGTEKIKRQQKEINEAKNQIAALWVAIGVIAIGIVAITVILKAQIS